MKASVIAGTGLYSKNEVFVGSCTAATRVLEGSCTVASVGSCTAATGLLESSCMLFRGFMYSCY